MDYFLGKNCEHSFAPCKRLNCGRNSHTCYNKRTLGFECACRSDYSGVLCNQRVSSSCDTTGCVNGNCVLDPLTGNKNCECLSSGFNGTMCENELCDPQCQNGGLCTIDQNGNAYCNCPNGLIGAFCEYGELRSSVYYDSIGQSYY